MSLFRRDPPTLGACVNRASGSKLIVELKDESAIEGVLRRCGCQHCQFRCKHSAMDLQLSDVTLYRRRHKGQRPQKFEQLFVRGKHIRFIHFDDFKQVYGLLNFNLKRQNKVN